MTNKPEGNQKIWIVLDKDRELNIVDVRVYKEKPKWELDFYESAFERVLQDQ